MQQLTFSAKSSLFPYPKMIKSLCALLSKDQYKKATKNCFKSASAHAPFSQFCCAQNACMGSEKCTRLFYYIPSQEKKV